MYCFLKNRSLGYHDPEGSGCSTPSSAGSSSSSRGHTTAGGMGPSASISVSSSRAELQSVGVGGGVGGMRDWGKSAVVGITGLGRLIDASVANTDGAGHSVSTSGNGMKYDTGTSGVIGVYISENLIALKVFLDYRGYAYYVWTGPK